MKPKVLFISSEPKDSSRQRYYRCDAPVGLLRKEGYEAIDWLYHPFPQQYNYTHLSVAYELIDMLKQYDIIFLTSWIKEYTGVLRACKALNKKVIVDGIPIASSQEEIPVLNDFLLNASFTSQTENGYSYFVPNVIDPDSVNPIGNLRWSKQHINDINNRIHIGFIEGRLYDMDILYQFIPKIVSLCKSNEKVFFDFCGVNRMSRGWADMPTKSKEEEAGDRSWNAFERKLVTEFGAVEIQQFVLKNHLMPEWYPSNYYPTFDYIFNPLQDRLISMEADACGVKEIQDLPTRFAEIEKLVVPYKRQDGFKWVDVVIEMTKNN